MNGHKSLSLGPFESKGELVLNDLHLDPIIAYLKPLVPLESLAATLSSSLNYHVQIAPGGQPQVDITGLMLEIENFEIHGLTPVTEIIDIPKVLLSGGTLQYPQQILQFSELSIDSPHLISWVKEDLPGDTLFPELDLTEWTACSETEYSGFKHIHYQRINNIT